MAAKTNFVLASRWLSPANQGGVAMHNGYLVDALKDNIEISLISIKDEANEAYYKGKNIPFRGIDPKLPPIAIKSAKTSGLKNGLRAWKDWLISLEMARVLERNPPDVVEFMDIHSEAYAFLKRNPAGRRKTKVVIRSHTPWGILRPTYFPEEIKGVDGWWAIKREQYCFKHCDAITTPSQDLKEQLIRVYRLPESKITVIPNLVDTNHFRPLPANNNDIFTFLHVGRFERAKGVITMTKAFIELCKETAQPVRLINVGAPRGNALEKCTNLLKEAKLLDRVTFTGFVPYEELPNYYAMADAVIVPPEIYESFSYTAAQAIACGKKVIASDSGGMPETLSNGKHGLIFLKADHSSLTKEMETSLNKNISTEELKRFAQNSYSIESLREKFLSFYNII
ncbi:glycosyltransferase family 4 protein [Phaeodactylibacter xiamenensis]|uniref:glycosyltransferase family 4 protein n=1 Tax=Phaeodactylibacter xiamenensis TaxID=1524460 RepID=UPI003CCBD4A1